MIRLSIATVVFAAALFLGIPALAQTSAPSPSPTPLAGFSARGTLSVAVNLPGAPTPVGMSAEIAVMAKARRVRVDVLKFASTSADKGSSDMVSHFLPTGAISVVFNQDTRTLTLWSEQKREYYQSKTTPAAKTKPTATPAPSTQSPVDQILKVMRSVTEYDSYTETLTLVGHQPVNGHTSSVFHLTIQSQKHGGKLQNISSDMAFADDLSGIPVRMWLTSTGQYDGNVKLDLLSAAADVPDPSVFAIPAGYKKVASLMELFAKGP